MVIDWVELSRAIPYAGIAIIFGVFVLALLERQDKKDRDREAAETAKEAARAAVRRAEQERQDAKDAARDLRFIGAMGDRDREWRDYMGQERTRQAEGMTLLTKELEHVAAIGALTNQLVKDHDLWERTIYETAKQRRSGDTGPLGTRQAGD